MSHHRAGLLACVPTILSLNVFVSAADVVVEAPRPSLTAPGSDGAKVEADRQPGGATVITAETWLSGRSSTWKDMLGLASGVFIQSRHGAAESRMSIRGSGLQRTFHQRGLLLLADGIPINLADGSGDFQSIDPTLADHVVVYRGANGHALGAANLGGAIDVVSPTGRSAAPLDVRFEAGSYGYARATVAGGTVSGAWDGWVGASASGGEGYREHARSQDQRVQGNVGYAFSDTLENRAYIGVANTISALPGSLTRAQLEDDPRQANAANVAGDQHRDYPLIRAADRLAFDDGVHRVDVAVAYSWKDLFHPIFQVIDQLSHDGLGSVRYACAGETHHVTVLATHGLGLVHAQQFINVAGDRGAQTADGYQRSSNSSVDLADEVRLNSATWITVGMQVAQATRDFDDHFLSNGDQSDGFSYRAASPRFDVRHELAEQVQIYGNVSRSFEAPSFGEIVPVGTAPGLLDLDAQTATTVELGTRGDLSRARWDASVYYAWVRDELIGFQVAPGQTRTLNANRTRHAGIELGGDVVPIEDLYADGRIRLRASYLLNWFRFTDDDQFGNNQIAGVPPTAMRGEALYEFAGGWYAGPSVEAAAAGYVDHANTTQAPGWALLGAKAGYRAAQGFSAWIEGRNLLGKTYAATYGVLTTATATSAVYNPGDGRAVYVGAGWRW